MYKVGEITLNDLPEVLGDIITQNAEIIEALRKGDPDKKMLTPEAAQYMGITEHALLQLVKQKDAPRCYRPGKAYHFFKRDLDAWVKNHPRKVQTRREKVDNQLAK